VTATPSPKAVVRARPNPPITISFGGDVHFDGISRPALSGGMRYIAPLLKPADIAMVNLETAITTRGTPEPKTYHFRAPASAFSALRGAGVDVVTMANNHGVDYGPVGLSDTLAAITASKFPVVGIGHDEDEAFRPWRTTVRGQRLAFIGASQVIDDNLRDTWPARQRHPGIASAYDVPRLMQAVRDAKRTSDIVVVYVHWGTERDSCPNGKQRALAPQLVTAGADVIVGSHAHVLHGAGFLGRSFVDYGLGNFVFYKRGDGLVAQTGVLTLTVRRHSVDTVAFAPAHIMNGLPYPVTGAAAERARTYWLQLRGCTGLKTAAAA
jgi:poly-gamma-glutamate synthesis protein (capsule biosynthesis protein)